MVDRARYVFRLSAWNELAGVDDFYQLFYFIRNDGKTDIEIIEMKHRKKFLARMAYPNLKLDDIRPGSKVVIYSKQYKVEDYEDKITKDTLGKAQAVAFAIAVEPRLFGQLLLAAEASGLKLSQARMVTLSAEDAAAVRPMLSPASLSSGAAVAVQFVGEDASTRVRNLVAHVHEHVGGGPQTVLCPAAGEDDAALTRMFFGPARERLASARFLSGTFSSCTCALILPSAMMGGAGPRLLSQLLERLEEARPPLTVSALRTLDMSRAEATEYMEVYKHVAPDYVEMVDEISTGPILALEITGQDAVSRVREIAGPRDGEVGKRIRPDCLRAQYGMSAAKPGLHVTDLVEDGPLECEYVFSILDRA